jgi:hypothetical protein
MSNTEDNSGIDPAVANLLKLVRTELWNHFRRDSHHSCVGRVAHVYFEPVMRGKTRYEDRELMTIEARDHLHRVRAKDRFAGADLKVPRLAPEILEDTDLEVHISLQNPAVNWRGTHALVSNVGDAFSEFMRQCSWMVQNASALNVTMILLSGSGPVAILVGDSTSGELTEDRQALMQARIANALKN